MTGIAAATRDYERWLGARVALVRADLAAKHERMAESRAALLRATYYRWAELWPARCPALARDAGLLAVGDLHVGNFGTWRNAEARLVWGMNDFDEAHVAAWSHDLVRLVASAIVARAEGALRIAPRAAAEAALAGYAGSLARGGEPFVLEERHGWLRALATSAARDPDRFWARLSGQPAWRGKLPPGARAALESALPRPPPPWRLVRRRSGIGSLGRPRVTAIVALDGGLVAREAKPLLTSAGDRAAGRDEARLLAAMGAETANLHLATPRAARAALAALRRRRDARWLVDAAERMAASVDDDWRAWRRG